MLFSQIFSVCLRGGALLGKFILILVLAKYLEPSDLGVYGIFVVTVSFSTYLLGLDFYTFSTRELLGMNIKKWPAILRDQAVFYGLTYMVVLPLLFLVFVVGFVPINLLGLFYVILILEHLGQEVYRLLVAIGRPVQAGIMHFLRAGAWCFVVALLLAGGGVDNSLIMVMKIWVAGGFGGLLIGLWSLRNLEWRSVSSVRVNWLWISRGIRVAGLLLVGTLFLRGIFTFDRYVLKLYQGDEAVGIYTFFVTVCMAVQSFLDAGVLAFIYPKVVESFRMNRIGEYRAHVRKLWVSVVAGSLLLAAILAVLIYPIVLFAEKQMYLDHISMFGLVIGAILMYCFSMVPHYQLYARSADKYIVGVHAVGFGVFIVLALWLVPRYGIYGASWSLLTSFITIFLAKLVGNKGGKMRAA